MTNKNARVELDTPRAEVLRGHVGYYPRVTSHGIQSRDVDQ